MTSPQPTPPPAVRVLVVDDQRLIRDGITTLLAIQPGIELVGTAANGQEAVEQACALSPDLVLMDVRMPVMDGVAATVAVRQQVPSCQVLMLSTFDDDPYVIRAPVRWPGRMPTWSPLSGGRDGQIPPDSICSAAVRNQHPAECRCPPVRSPPWLMPCLAAGRVHPVNNNAAALLHCARSEDRNQPR